MAETVQQLSESNAKGNEEAMAVLISSLGDQRTVVRDDLPEAERGSWDYLKRYRPSVDVTIGALASLYLQYNAKVAAKPLALHISKFARAHLHGTTPWTEAEYGFLNTYMRTLIDVTNASAWGTGTVSSVLIVCQTEDSHIDVDVMPPSYAKTRIIGHCCLGSVINPGNRLANYIDANGEIPVLRQNLDSLALTLAGLAMQDGNEAVHGGSITGIPGQ